MWNPSLNLTDGQKAIRICLHHFTAANCVQLKRELRRLSSNKEDGILFQSCEETSLCVRELYLTICLILKETQDKDLATAE